MYENEIYHHGIKGQRWGVRRWQNADGSLKSGGAAHYQKQADSLHKKIDRLQGKIDKNNDRKAAITAKFNKHSVKNAVQDAKVAKWKQRRSAIQKKVSKINNKVMVRGKDVNFFEKRTLKKAYRLDKKIASGEKAKLRYDTKISKLDAQNAKLKKKVDRYLDKYEFASSMASLKESDVSSGRSAVSAMMGG